MADDELIYLDNNATTQLDPAVIEEMLLFLTTHYGNPSSGYGFAAKARKAVELARERLAALLGCEPQEMVFTSGGTESNNAVINSALQFINDQTGEVPRRCSLTRAASSPPDESAMVDMSLRAPWNTARCCTRARTSQNEGAM